MKLFKKLFKLGLTFSLMLVMFLPMVVGAIQLEENNSTNTQQSRPNLTEIYEKKKKEIEESSGESLPQVEQRPEAPEITSGSKNPNKITEVLGDTFKVDNAVLKEAKESTWVKVVSYIIQKIVAAIIVLLPLFMAYETARDFLMISFAGFRHLLVQDGDQAGLAKKIFLTPSDQLKEVLNLQNGGRNARPMGMGMQPMGMGGMSSMGGRMGGDTQEKKSNQIVRYLKLRLIHIVVIIVAMTLIFGTPFITVISTTVGDFVAMILNMIINFIQGR